MKRRPKVIVLDDGKPWDGAIPAWALRFQPEDWPGVQPWEQWDNWWNAAREWAEKHLPAGMDELIPLMPEQPSRPWNQAEI